MKKNRAVWRRMARLFAIACAHSLARPVDTVGIRRSKKFGTVRFEMLQNLSASVRQLVNFNNIFFNRRFLGGRLYAQALFSAMRNSPIQHNLVTWTASMETRAVSDSKAKRVAPPGTAELQPRFRSVHSRAARPAAKGFRVCECFSAVHSAALRQRSFGG